MVLQMAAVLLAASVFQEATQEPPWATVLPADCGLSEEQVLEMAIPKFHELVVRSTRNDPDTWFDDRFDAFVAGAVETDLGFTGRPFLIAAISIQHGGCDACYSASLIAMDLRRRVILWRSDPYEAWLSRRVRPEYGGDPLEPPVLRVFRMFPDDPMQTVAFRFGSEDPFHGEGSTDEHWLRPRADSGDLSAFDTVWHETVEFGTSGRAWGGWPHETSSEMTSLWPRHAYRFTRHTVIKWEESFGSVDIQITVEYTQEPHSHTLVAGPASVGRKDRGPVTIFPFSVPVVAVVFDPVLLPPKPKRNTAGFRLSPGGNLFAERAHGRCERPWHLRLCRAGDGTLIRDVWSGLKWPPNSGNSECDDGLSFLSIGWTDDGSRCLVILGLGLHGIPPVLVSLTPDGKGDRWEGFLPQGYTLPDGFVIDLPETVSTPETKRPNS